MSELERSGKPVVAVVFDFDDTLAPDTTSQLLGALGVDVFSFWEEEVAPLLAEGWDPNSAYLDRLIAWSRAGRLSEPLTRERLERAGREVELYPGVEGLLERLHDEANAQDPGIALEFYVITSGLERLVASTAVGSQLTQLWGCEFDYDASGEVRFPRNLVSFTDKTRYLFQIEKGLVAPRAALDPFAVNHKVACEQIRVPFEHMIYVGDGYTDVPCFSLVAGRGGIPLAVVDPRRRERWGRAWGFIEEGRALNVCPSDYSEGGPADMVIRMALQSVCDRIALAEHMYRR